VTGLRVGDRVWVGVEANPTPGHVLSIHHTRTGRIEYVIRTLDLAGRAGENLKLRVYETDRASVLRPRPMEQFVDRPVREGLGHDPR
jgi:hypothetical protein